MNYFKIWLAGARYSLVRTMMFRGDFFIWSLVELLWMGVNLLLPNGYARWNRHACSALTDGFLLD